MDLLIRLLIGIIIIAVVLWLSRVALAGLPLDSTVRGIIIAIVALICLILLLEYTGILNVVGP